MAYYHSIGDALVSEKEMKKRKGEIKEFKEEIKRREGKRGPKPTLEFSTGTVKASDLTPSHIPPDRKNRQKFKDINIGLPLSVMIRHVYTGRYGGNDMLVTSSMKSLATFNARPRAVNFLVKEMRRKEHLRNPSATRKGTPLVFYTPALIDENTIITFEIILAGIREEIFDNISDAFITAAGIPIFATQAVGLVAAGIIARIVRQLLDVILNRSPFLTVDMNLSFNLGGELLPDKGFKLVTKETWKKEIRKKHYVDEKGDVVRKDNPDKEYEGDYPYIITSLDGRNYKKYEKFIPTAASAALLEKFYNIRGEKAPLDILTKAMTLYNDMDFKGRADKVLSKLNKIDMKSNPDEYEKKKTEYKALVANILSEEIKKIAQRQNLSEPMRVGDW